MEGEVGASAIFNPSDESDRQAVSRRVLLRRAVSAHVVALPASEIARVARSTASAAGAKRLGGRHEGATDDASGVQNAATHRDPLVGPADSLGLVDADYQSNGLEMLISPSFVWKKAKPMKMISSQMTSTGQ